MATNLRLRPETEAALRAEAERTGRSQQQLIREALDEYLNLRPPVLASRSMDELVAAGIIHPPTEPFRRAHRLLELPDGVTSLDLLDREDRF